jgi:hypothetical protein
VEVVGGCTREDLQQGKIYVTDKNKGESVPELERSFYWRFVATHYDLRSNSCKVMYDRFVSGLGTILEQLRIDDIEGNRVAGYRSIWTSNRNGRPAYSRPTECEVNGTAHRRNHAHHDQRPLVAGHRRSRR